MLAILEARVGNAPEDELPIAAAEQSKISKIRLAKLLQEYAV
jgi:2-oxo-4-hydroxy-4-carboxy-5-ureidoimidazoline decarboxylase